MNHLFRILIGLLFLSCSGIEDDKIFLEKSFPKVINVFPTADTLPENLLRFYIQFSHPMKAINNLEHIKLFDEEGLEVHGAIFNNVYELWDELQQQLTLILDPARVKTGLEANQKLGRALKPNKKYQLTIEKAEDIYGNPLAQKYTKEILVTSIDTIIPDIKNWNIHPPLSNNRSPLKISFPQSLDRLSLYHRIQILDPNGNRVAGRVKIGNKEKSWHFIPHKKWKKGTYSLAINSRLEDPAGNNINGLFDHKIGGLKQQNEGDILNLVVEVL